LPFGNSYFKWIALDLAGDGGKERQPHFAVIALRG
jgi:hypothetical protein